MNKQFLLSIKEYIEETEVQIEGEWGSCRELEKLIKDNNMPDIYNEVLTLLEEV